LATAVANLTACSTSSGDSQISLSGSGGSNGSRCTTVTCLPTVTTHIVWDVKIDPPNVAGAAVTATSIDLDREGLPLTLTTDSQSPVNATFTAPPTGAVPSSASIVLTAPPLISGLPDLTFQAVAVTTMTNATTASLSVPSRLLGSTVTMTLVPIPPADQQSPPYTVSVPLTATLTAKITSNNFSINGKLLDALAKPTSTTFVARAFQLGAQVSNAPLTQADGSFQLLVPSITNAALPLTIQLTPQSQNDPWFISSNVSLSNPIPTPFPPFMLAAYTAPSPITVVAQDAANNNVSGALVRAQTTVLTSLLGTTDFARSATTDSSGTASLSLLPGSNSAPLTYSFVVIPPAGSSSATTCPPSVTLPVLTPPTFTLQRRPNLVGAVTDGQGNPVANVAITATPDSSPVPSCPSTPAAPGNTTTDANGVFSLPLDPGTYQLDYDPPAGSAAPRFTEYQVAVPVLGGGTDGGTPMIPPHPVQLPVAAAVAGTVVGPDGTTPLPSATVRFFETRGAVADGGTPLAPLLRAQTVTDANGAFRVAVALPN
jgi:hypothetical protein